MKKKFLSIIILFLLFFIEAQSYKKEIQELMSRDETLEYTRPLKVNNQFSNYYFAYFTSRHWDYTYKRKGITCPIVVRENNKFKIVNSIYPNKYFSEVEDPTIKNEKIINTAFFYNYENSNFYKQFNSYKLDDCLVFVVDIDNDGNEEILNFGQAEINSSSGFVITKYIGNEWKTVFSQSYFGFYDWNPSILTGEPNDKSMFDEEWYTPKPFPYDFVEYKGKIGLRIICYDRPKDWPTHYHAQFWAYDEKMQKYEMLEEIWEAEEDTPPDGLIFAGAKEGLFK